MQPTPVKENPITLEQDSGLKSLQQQGFYLAKNSIDSELIEQIRQRIGEHISRFAKAYLTEFSACEPEFTIDTRLNQVAKNNFGYGQSLLNAVLSDSQNDPLIGDLIHSDVLTQHIANLLLGFKVTGITTRVRACVADYQRFHTPWHQDLADESRSEGGCNTVRLTCWIPLSDVDENTGALACAPGHYPASIMQRQGTGGYKIIDEESLEKNKKVLKCNKGDALFLDRFLPHKSLPIQQNLSRWSIVNWIKAEPNNC